MGYGSDGVDHLGLLRLFTHFRRCFLNSDQRSNLIMAVEQLGYESALSSRLEIFRSDVARTLGLLLFCGHCLSRHIVGKS